MYPQGISPIGALDMCGNVWEWCLNEYRNPENTGVGEYETRVLCGGAYDRDADLARSSYRDGLANAGVPVR